MHKEMERTANRNPLGSLALVAKQDRTLRQTERETMTPNELVSVGTVLPNEVETGRFRSDAVG